MYEGIHMHGTRRAPVALHVVLHGMAWHGIGSYHVVLHGMAWHGMPVWNMEWRGCGTDHVVLHGMAWGRGCGTDDFLRPMPYCSHSSGTFKVSMVRGAVVIAVLEYTIRRMVGTAMARKSTCVGRYSIQNHRQITKYSDILTNTATSSHGPFISTPVSENNTGYDTTRIRQTVCTSVAMSDIGHILRAGQIVRILYPVFDRVLYIWISYPVFDRLKWDR